MADRMLPIGPLQLWVWRQEQLASRDLVADRAGVTGRSLGRWMNELAEVSERRVDSVLTRCGERFSDVYSDEIIGGATRARSVLAWVGMALDALPDDRAKSRRCRWGGGCREIPDTGYVFCGEHAGILAGIRAELLAEGR